MKQTPPHNIVNNEILSLIPEHSRRIVEIGCSYGALAQAFRATHPNTEYIGVDIEADYVEIASQHCTGTITGNIETLAPADFNTLFPSDCWIFGDSLEHLYDPWLILKRVREAIDPDGCVLACIPNAQHWSMQWRLLSGFLQYNDSGLMDRTHLRWFTRTTMLEMFEQSGWQAVRGIARNIESPHQNQMLEAIRTFAIANGLDPEIAVQDAIPAQYVFKLIPAH